MRAHHCWLDLCPALLPDLLYFSMQHKDARGVSNVLVRCVWRGWRRALGTPTSELHAPEHSIPVTRAWGATRQVGCRWHGVHCTARASKALLHSTKQWCVRPRCKGARALRSKRSLACARTLAAWSSAWCRCLAYSVSACRGRMHMGGVGGPHGAQTHMHGWGGPHCAHTHAWVGWASLRCLLLEPGQPPVTPKLTTPPWRRILQGRLGSLWRACIACLHHVYEQQSQRSLGNESLLPQA